MAVTIPTSRPQRTGPHQRSVERRQPVDVDREAEAAEDGLERGSATGRPAWTGLPSSVSTEGPQAPAEALDEARAAIAEWLDVSPDAFDVEA